MAKALRCRDVGVDCDFEARAETVGELLQQCAEHGKTAHGMSEVPPEMVAQIQAAIKDV